jgi:hypothetical protein
MSPSRQAADDGTNGVLEVALLLLLPLFVLLLLLVVLLLLLSLLLRPLVLPFRLSVVDANIEAATTVTSGATGGNDAAVGCCCCDCDATMLCANRSRLITINVTKKKVQ